MEETVPLCRSNTTSGDMCDWHLVGHAYQAVVAVQQEAMVDC
jgi:hypothetical protein